jgi:hypothetical protein
MSDKPNQEPEAMDELLVSLPSRLIDRLEVIADASGMDLNQVASLVIWKGLHAMSGIDCDTVEDVELGGEA